MREEERLISSLATAGCCGRYADSVTGGFGVEAERTFSQVGDPHLASSREADKSKYMVLVPIGCSQKHGLTLKGEIGGAC